MRNKPQSGGNSLQGGLAGSHTAVARLFPRLFQFAFVGTYVLLLGNGKRLGAIFQF